MFIFDNELALSYHPPQGTAVDYTWYTIVYQYYYEDIVIMYTRICVCIIVIFSSVFELISSYEHF